MCDENGGEAGDGDEPRARTDGRETDVFVAFINIRCARACGTTGRTYRGGSSLATDTGRDNGHDDERGHLFKWCGVRDPGHVVEKGKTNKTSPD